MTDLTSAAPRQQHSTRLPALRLGLYWLASRLAWVVLAASFLFAGVAEWLVRLVTIVIGVLLAAAVLTVAMRILRWASWDVVGGASHLRRRGNVQIARAVADGSLAILAALTIRFGPQLELWPSMSWYPGTSVVLATAVALALAGVHRSREVEGRRNRAAVRAIHGLASLAVLVLGIAFGPPDWLPGQFALALVAITLGWASTRLATMADGRR